MEVLALFGRLSRRKHGGSTSAGCKRNMKKKWQEWSVYGECKVCLTERGTNISRTMRWREGGPGAYQHFQREDWYWKTDTSFNDKKNNHREAPRSNPSYSRTHYHTIMRF